MFGVTILGNNSAVPAYDRHPTAQIVTLGDQLFLIDCGEGTQMQLAKYKIRQAKINHIFISHLHGDHYFGLIGLLTSMGLMGRKNELRIYAPEKLKEIIELQLIAAQTTLSYPLLFYTIKEDKLLIDNKTFSVECFKVNHRITCFGFLITEKKKPRKINKAKVQQFNIPTIFFSRLQDGENYITSKGEIIKNEWVTIANTPPRNYAFCADTIYTESFIDKINNVSLLYHESTYLKIHANKAEERFHSTAEQAAMIAKKVNAKILLIGHFSSRYEKLDSFLVEAKEIFENTHLALEGNTYLIT